jgi:hypothetical protein
LANSVSGPEKAGVSGSIPSLATMLSKAYKAPLQHFHSISFQNWRETIRLVWNAGAWPSGYPLDSPFV